MRKSRVWASTNDFKEIKVEKPSGLLFQIKDNLLTLKWLLNIGCVSGYYIYGSENKVDFEKIGETNNNYFVFELKDSNYYIYLTAYFNNYESEKTEIFKVKEAIIKSKVVEAEPVKIIDIPIIQEKEEKKQIQFPFGLCSCCVVPQPLMKRKDKVICSKNIEQAYEFNNVKWIPKVKQILSDVEKIDELLRQNSAYVGIGGILLK